MNSRSCESDGQDALDRDRLLEALGSEDLREEDFRHASRGQLADESVRGHVNSPPPLGGGSPDVHGLATW